jgi:E3 ubiquitin-protein ligase MARCH6
VRRPQLLHAAMAMAMQATVSDDEDELECRICRSGVEPDRPLFHPCKCSGSIKFTHEDCLVNWLAQSGTVRCELCHHSFRFEPLYQPNTPTALPTDELFRGVLSRVRASILTAARVTLVLTVWLFFLPLGTCWTWYALFISSLSQLPGLIAGRGLSGVVTDAFYGCILSATIVFVFLGVSSLREYIRHDHGVMLEFDVDVHHHDHRPQHHEHHHQNDGEYDDEDHNLDQLIGDEEDIDGVDGRGDGEENLGPADPVVGADGVAMVDADEVVDEVDAIARDVFAGPHELQVGAFGGFLQNDEDDEDHALNDDGNAGSASDASSVVLEDIGLFDYLPPLENAGIENEDEQDIGHAPGDRGEGANLAFAADRAEADADEANDEGGALFGLFELDPDADVPLEEMVGLRGQLRNLFDNAGTVLVSNAIFLGIFTLIPLLVGRLALRVASLRAFPLVSIAKSSLSSTAATVASSVVPSLDIAVTASHVASASSLSSATSAAIVDQPIVSYIDNLFIVLLGYGVISLVAFAYVIVNSLLRSRYPRLDTPMTRQVVRLLRYLATFVKIIVLILFEFGIFPLGCGWWLDLCTLKIVSSSLESRVSFCREFPWMCTAGHWFLGIFYMVHISLFVSLLREVLRPQLLWFLRNPDDPEFHPFRELVEKPLWRHARRICLSVMIYAPLIVTMVYIPSQFCMILMPNVFPLRILDIPSSLVYLPFGNALIVPVFSLVHRAKPGVVTRRLLRTWITHVGGALDIADLVARADDPNTNLDGGVADVGIAANGDRGDNARAGEDDLFAPFNDDELGEDRQVNDVVPADVDGNLGAVELRELRKDYEAEDNSLVPNGEANLVDACPVVRNVRVRGALMIFLAWVTMITGECIALTVPTVIGRAVMHYAGLPMSHDLHSFGIGLYVILFTGEVASRTHKFLSTVDVTTAMRLTVPYIVVVLKSLLLATVWFGFLPLGAGLLVELTVTVPMRVAPNESPYLYLHQDWALGLLMIKVWSRIVLAGGLNPAWRERLERAREGGFLGAGRNFWRTVREVVGPVVCANIVALAAPYAFAHGLLPAVGISHSAACVVYRYIYVWLVFIYFTGVLGRYTATGLHALHDSIRDDKYLVGRRLYNYATADRLQQQLHQQRQQQLQDQQQQH